MPSASVILSVFAAISPAVLAQAQYGNYSTPVAYTAPPYKGSASVPVYGEPPKSTPCTSSSSKRASSTPGYPVYPPNSVPNYGDYPSYPVSTPVKNDYPVSTPKNDYPSYPASTPKNDYPAYPPTTSSKPSYDDSYKPPVSKTTITTTYTTTYVDICETGYITKTTTFAVTYCPTTTPAVPTPGKPKNPPTWGWDITTKVCNKGCGEGPKTVTITVPCTQCNYAKSTPTPAVPSKPVCNGYDCGKDFTSTRFSTKIITVTKTPIYDSPKSTPVVSKPASSPVVSKPNVPVSSPASKPNVPASSPVVSKPVVSSPVSKPNVPASSPVISKPAVPTPNRPTNGTMSIGTGVRATPSKTGYNPPVFTGAAAGVQAGGFVAMIAVGAAMFL